MSAPFKHIFKICSCCIKKKNADDDDENGDKEANASNESPEKQEIK